MCVWGVGWGEYVAEKREAKEESVLASFLLILSQTSLRAGERPVTNGSRREENTLAERQGALLESQCWRPGRGSQALPTELLCRLRL